MLLSAEWQASERDARDAPEDVQAKEEWFGDGSTGANPAPV